MILVDVNKERTAIILKLRCEELDVNRLPTWELCDVIKVTQPRLELPGVAGRLGGTLPSTVNG